MRRIISFLFFISITLGSINLTLAEVTHAEIRGSIQSLIYSYNQLDNKLERHEHRERALGDLLKKAMQTLQMGQKRLEPIHGIFARLDERVSQIETLLIAQEEKYLASNDKFKETLEFIFKWMRENNECYNRPPVLPNSAAIQTAPAQNTNNIPTEFIEQQKETNKELVYQIKKLKSNVDQLLDTSKNMMEHTEVVFKSAPTTAEMLSKIEDKLISYSVAVAEQPTDNKEFEQKVLEKFLEVNEGIVALKAATPKPTPPGLTTQDKEFIQNLANETMHMLELVKNDALSASDKALAKTTTRIKESEENIEINIKQVFDGVTDSAEVLDKFYHEMNASYNKFNEGLEIFNKFNNILMANSEYVLDTQRKVEFGTIQVVQKINDLLDKQRNEVMTLLKERFNNVDEHIVNQQIETLQNISTLIETEISHVWRQIQIMNDEVSDTKDLITLLQGRNEAYVNHTFSSMDTMGNKVEEIKGRMLDMDSNLNFLLGKLSVMSQEFKQIKVGLAESLEELRNTFHTMQDKMPTGPGPHNIAKNAYETELNLLQKRHAADVEIKLK